MNTKFKMNIMSLIMKKKLLTIVIVLNILIALIVLFIVHDNFMSVINDGNSVVKELKKSSGIPLKLKLKLIIIGKISNTIENFIINGLNPIIIKIKVKAC